MSNCAPMAAPSQSSDPSAPLRRGRRPSRGWPTLLTLLLALACGDDPVPLPSLPDSGEGRQWFWRDVLSEPLGDEAPPRTDLLALESPDARVAALAELVERDDPAALTTLMTALRDPVTGVALAAAQGLGELGDPAAIPRLLKGLGPYPIEYDTSIHLRAAEAAALARLGSPAGVPLALMLLEEDTADQAPRVDLPWEPTSQLVFLRELALPVFEVLAGTDFGYEPNGSVPARQAAARKARAWWDQRRLRLWSRSPAEGPGLTARLRLMVAHLGAYQLRQIDGARFTLAHVGPAVLTHLREGLSSEDVYVRVHVLEVMRDLAPLTDTKGHARLAVVAAGPLLEDPELLVATTAASVCAAAAIPDPLVAALDRRTEPEVRLAVVDALGATRTAVAGQVLERFVADQAGLVAAAPDLAVAVEAALLACDLERPTQAFLDLLAHPDPDLAYPAWERLVALTGSDHGLDPLAPPDQRRQAVDAARRALASRAP